LGSVLQEIQRSYSTDLITGWLSYDTMVVSCFPHAHFCVAFAVTRQAWAGIERFLLGLYEESEATLYMSFLLLVSKTSVWIFKDLP
jgi:hypothetical protein